MNNIFFIDKEELEQKIQKIKQEGRDNLHIVSDFDNTLSKAYVNGEKVQSMIGQVRKLGYLGKDYDTKYDELFNTYHPIEIDPYKSFEEKSKAMEKWWSSHIKVLSGFGLSKKILDDTIKESKHFVLRDKISELFDLLEKNIVPILIFSAGSKDFINGYLKKDNIDAKNISIIANEYDFDSEGKVKGYKNKIIHSFNKGEVAIKNDSHYKNILNRKNVILLGDSLGDLEMSKGIEHSTIITIGFYNSPQKEHLQEYLKVFDVVITEDASLEYVVELLKKVL